MGAASLALAGILLVVFGAAPAQRSMADSYECDRFEARPLFHTCHDTAVWGAATVTTGLALVPALAGLGALATSRRDRWYRIGCLVVAGVLLACWGAVLADRPQPSRAPWPDPAIVAVVTLVWWIAAGLVLVNRALGVTARLASAAVMLTPVTFVALLSAGYYP